MTSKLALSMVLPFLLFGCYSQPGTWMRGEYEPPTYTLTPLQSTDALIVYRFPSDMIPSKPRDGKWCVGEPPASEPILSSDIWIPVFNFGDFRIVASDEYKSRQCRVLADTFGKTKPKNVCPDAGLFHTYYDLCVRDRDFLLMIDRDLQVVGWSRLGSRYAFRDGRPKNPAPLPNEMWNNNILMQAMPNPRFKTDAARRAAQP